MTNELVTLFRAKNLKKVAEGGGDETEDILVHTIPLAGIQKWLEDQQAAGLLVDPRVYVGLYALSCE